MKGNKGYIYALDSMRVLAMLGVMLFHLLPEKVSGGFLGVITFFVLSGYLTMREIVLRGIQNPILSLGAKLKKLMPELIAMVTITVMVMTLTLSEYLPDVKNQAISSVFGMNNIVQILDGESYFAAMASLKPFTHIWAHSMELQFYLFLLLTAGVSYTKQNRRCWVAGFSVLAVASILLMQSWYADPREVTRIYYGTDTRIFSFLIGAIGAMLFSESGSSSSFLRGKLHTTLTIVLTVFSVLLFFTVENGESVYRYLFVFYSLIQLALIYLLSDKKSAAYRIFSKNFIVSMSKRSYSLYLWHFPVVKLYEKMMWTRRVPVAVYVLLELALVFVITEFFYRLFSQLRERNLRVETRRGRGNKNQHKYKRMFQRLRYTVVAAAVLGICIYPYKPVGDIANEKYRMLMRLKNQITDVDVNIGGAKPPIPSVTVAGSSNVEAVTKSPVRSFAADEIHVYEDKDEFSSVHSNEVSSEIVYTANETDSAISSSSDDPTSSVDSPSREISASSDASPAPSVGMTSSDETSTAVSTTSATFAVTEVEVLSATRSDSLVESPEISHMREVFESCRNEFPGVDITFEEYLRIRERKITLIGDSISVMTSPKLAEFFPNIEISAKTNRQSYHAFEFYSEMKAEGRVGDVVILALGANGNIDYETYDLVRNDIGERPLIVNTVILPWPVTEAERNDAIHKYAEERNNVYVAKWYEHCKNKPGILYDDGVHPIETDGAVAHAFVMMEAVYRALESTQNP